MPIALTGHRFVACRRGARGADPGSAAPVTRSRCLVAPRSGMP